MKIVTNRCWGGFGLSHEAVMEYAKRKGFRLYAYVDARDKDGNFDFVGGKFVAYHEGDDAFLIHYSKEPLSPDGRSSDTGYFSGSEIPRDDLDLVAIVGEMGAEASDKLAQLEVITIPDGVEWEIDNYDGMETIHEKHQSWP